MLAQVFFIFSSDLTNKYSRYFNRASNSSGGKNGEYREGRAELIVKTTGMCEKIIQQRRQFYRSA
jgi:hypothetical protein